MKMLNSLKIGTRLTMGFTMILSLLIVLSAISMFKVQSIDRQLTVINDLNSVKQRYAINFRGSVHDRAIALRDIRLVAPDELGTVIADIDRLTAQYDASSGPLDALVASTGGDRERAILAGIKATQAKTLPLITEVVRLRQSGDEAAAKTVLMNDARPLFVEWLQRINQFIDLEEAKNKEIATSVRSTAEGFSLLTGLLCAGALLVGGGVAYWSVVSIKPLTRQVEVMGRLADGDFTAEVPDMNRGDEVGDIARAVQLFKDNGIDRVRLQEQASTAHRDQERRLKETEEAFEVANQEQRRIVEALAQRLGELADSNLAVELKDSVAPEYAQLKNDFNAAIASLRDAMRSVLTATMELREGSVEISSASDDLSRRTEQQAASLEETAAALDEITATVRRTAEGAGQARTIVSGTRASAERSGTVVREAVEAMSGIQKSSREISQIINVIDEIAFQTNLLALNAGVEAARAGDAGRGFAVVASEVRALAQRSAEAAKEIKSLILTSGAQVEQGVTLVGQTGEALVAIVAEVAKIDGIVGEIASSAQEQATGLDEVNNAINQMDQVTQQNAAMVEETTAAAANLRGKASELAELVQRFKTGIASPVVGRGSDFAPSGGHAPSYNPSGHAHRKVANFARRPAYGATA